MDKGQATKLSVHRLEDGGFIVLSDGFGAFEMRAPLKACTSIEEALQYIRHCLEPVLPQQPNTKKK